MTSDEEYSKEFEDISARLDRIIRLVEDLIILQGTGMGLSNGAIREILGVRMERVSRISRKLPRD
jgi:hypothetical protein